MEKRREREEESKERESFTPSLSAKKEPWESRLKGHSDTMLHKVQPTARSQSECRLYHSTLPIGQIDRILTNLANENSQTKKD